jgi:hypothetical protein
VHAVAGASLQALALRRRRASGGEKLFPAVEGSLHVLLFREAQDGRDTPSGSRAVLAAPSSPLSRLLGCRVLQGSGSAVGPCARGVGRVCSGEGLRSG